ncbi:MAG: hypothetical protein GVY10_08825 [Verrucomicrobia bacterium]|jgi:uncharacterized lipoprotein YmbA|nr:hypothetical protein [Verrucomicrobiota bacterium]
MKTFSFPARILLLLLLAGFLPACVQLDPETDPTRFYLLAGGTPPVGRDDVSKGEKTTLVVALQSSGFPEYARRSGLAVRHGDHEIRYAEWHQWAQAPEDDFLAAFAHALEAQAPGVRVVTWGTVVPARNGPPMRVLRLDIDRFEGHASGEARLSAQWQWQDPESAEPAPWQSFRTAASWRSDDYSTLVVAHSENLRALAAEVAEGL